MSELMAAVIGGGAAVIGGMVTGWFSRDAGHRQAAAAEAAGTRQAEALIATVQATLDEQRRVRRLDERRRAYTAFLDATKLPDGTAESCREKYAAMDAALSWLHLEGPLEVVQAAGAYMGRYEAELITGVGQATSAEELEQLLWDRERLFLREAQRALGIDLDGGQTSGA
ncbi:hypothetical protein [Streptomyces sp. t39]|uniref:hypothetical protein n=1 Tax=Streptomyces sp. t39 TaxID=1828156 RepID=UPI0011CEBD02|nr:hypothetical protein [Streptomyces sp. t39]TXS50155.1 hypothetical protein EAO77_28000 [Streptomyces sp. t39]